MSNQPLDDDGQPVNARLCARLRQDRTANELLGLAKAFVADGKISPEEAGYLRLWLEQNAKYADSWPVNVVNSRVQTIFADGVFDEHERLDLYSLLRELAGSPESLSSLVANFSTRLPFDSPPPDLEFEDKYFCLTGSFAFGSRKACQLEIVRRGGQIEDKVTTHLDYLVVGVAGSRDWAHSAFGRKIEKAVELRERYGVAIVGEDHWARELHKVSPLD